MGENGNPVVCAYCKGAEVVKFGRRYGKRIASRQTHWCKQCKRRFTAGGQFKKHLLTREVVAEVFCLYFEGLSLRQIVWHLKTFRRIEATHPTILSALRKTGKLLGNFVKTLVPITGKIWNADETYLLCRRGQHYAYMWNAFDWETRFLLSTLSSRNRSDEEATRLLKEAKAYAGVIPDEIRTDGYAAYLSPIRKHFWRTTRHVGKAGMAGTINNNMVERFHNTVQGRVKTMRGFQTPETANQLMGGFSVYYDFIRPHSALDGKTPAEAAGIPLGLGQNKALELLIISEQERKARLERGGQ